MSGNALAMGSPSLFIDSFYRTNSATYYFALPLTNTKLIRSYLSTKDKFPLIPLGAPLAPSSGIPKKEEVEKMKGLRAPNFGGTSESFSTFA